MSDNDEYPRPISDPEADGIPEYADADSTAYDEEPQRVADGPDPAPLPSDVPVAVEDYGTTAEEERQGEPLSGRLAREEPDVSPGSGRRDVDDDDRDSVEFDSDPHLDSQVSSYERLGDDPAAGQVGRLVEPDEGAHADLEADAVASDAGIAGGGPSAEELALHEERP